MELFSDWLITESAIDQVRGWHEVVSGNWPGGALHYGERKGAIGMAITKVFGGMDTTNDEVVSAANQEEFYKKVASRPNAFLLYATHTEDRSVRFTINNVGGRMFASVDFDWAGDTRPAPSEKDQKLVKDRSGAVASRSLQGTTRAFLMDMKQYAQLMKSLGVGFQYHAADQASEDPRRVGLYDRGLASVGYNRVGGVPKKAPVRYEHLVPTV